MRAKKRRIVVSILLVSLYAGCGIKPKATDLASQIMSVLDENDDFFFSKYDKTLKRGLKMQKGG